MLTLKKAQPNNMRRAIEKGEMALKLYEGFSDDIKYSEKVYKKITKIRYLMADIYSYDIYNTYDEANNMIEDFEDDLNGENQDLKQFITSSEIKQFKKKKNEIEVNCVDIF